MVHSLVATGGWLGLGIAPFLTRKTESNTVRMMIYIASPPVVAFVVTALFTVLYGIGYFTNQVITIMVRPDNIRTLVANLSIIVISFTGTITLSDLMFRMKQQTIDVAAAAEAIEQEDDEDESTAAEESDKETEEEADEESDKDTEENESNEEESEEATEEESDNPKESTANETKESNNDNDWKKSADFEKARNAPPLSDKDDE